VTDHDDGGAADGDAVVMLSEPVRQRLVLIASDVLGRLPAEEVPAALRTIAKFTPAKRARLGGASLSAALDADEEFRARVADVVAEASPLLTEAVRDRHSTAASDPVDTAVVAYLTRPDGWVDVVAEANARWAAEQAGSDRHADDIAALRAEVSELRARSKTQAVRVRDAVAKATADLAGQLDDVRRQLRARTGELRTAERGRADALRALGDAEQARAVQASAQEADLRRARARIGELERSATSVRRDARADRDVDDARLWLLVDTLAEAVAGIRRELSLAPTPVRPGDLVRSAEETGAPMRRTDDPAALDGLLALPNVHVIVDGYNVTKSGYPELALADQRNRLVIAMATLAGRTRAEVTIAFDGGAKPPAQQRTPRGVRVLFSASGEIADDLIRRLVAAEPPGRPLVVVTSDQQVVTDVLRAGAWAVPSAVLLARLG
jgi:predicted RNA-binding protein with PIN domain